jgi:hypothetical protein
MKSGKEGFREKKKCLKFWALTITQTSVAKIAFFLSQIEVLGSFSPASIIPIKEKMNCVFFKFLKVGVCVFVALTASAFALTYVVKKGDTLSGIAGQTLHGKIYGETGGLKKLVLLNPDLKNPDLIFPGDKINLSEDDYVLAEASAGLAGANRRPAEIEFEKAADQSLEVVKPEAIAPSQEEKEGYSLLETNPRFFYTRIDGIEPDNGSTGKLLSKLNYGISGSWRQLWSESFESYVTLGVTRFNLTSATNRMLENSKQTLADLEAGVRWHLTDKTVMLFSLGAGDEIFYRASSTSVVTIDSVMVPKLNFGLTQDLITKKPFTLGAELKLTGLSPTSTDSYSVKTGWAYQGRLFVKQEPKSSSLTLSTGVFYGARHQNTSYVNQKRTDVGIDFGLSWSFGK